MRKKLFPGRFPGMSPKFGAIVGFILGEKYTDPAIDDMCITVDGCVLAQHEDDCGMNDFVGAASDLESNWKNLLDCAGLTADERKEAESLYASAIMDWRHAHAS